jgi:hypothetical protein
VRSRERGRRKRDAQYELCRASHVHRIRMFKGSKNFCRAMRSACFDGKTFPCRWTAGHTRLLACLAIYRGELMAAWESGVSSFMQSVRKLRSARSDGLSRCAADMGCAFEPMDMESACPPSESRPCRRWSTMKVIRVRSWRNSSPRLRGADHHVSNPTFTTRKHSCAPSAGHARTCSASLKQLKHSVGTICGFG